MRAVVGPALLAFTVAHESYMLAFYKDVKGFVTIGLGMLVNDWYNVVESGLQFVGGDAHAAWSTVANDHTLDPRAGGAQYAKLTPVRATRESVDAFFLRELAAMEATLKKYLPNWDSAPADAQFAALSHAWAFGPAFPPKWPAWTKCFIAGDYAGASLQDVPSSAEMRVQNASFHARIATEQVRLANANQGDPYQLTPLAA